MTIRERALDLGSRALKAAEDAFHGLEERLHPARKAPPAAPPPPSKAADDQHDANLRAFARASQIPPPPSLCEAARGNKHDEFEKLDPRTLTLFQASDASGKEPIHYTDVVQGKLDDCYLLASIAAIASTQTGPAFLRSLIKETKTGYEVRLPGLDKTVTVSKTEFGKDRAGFGTMAAKREIWPMVIESACAKERGGYTAIGNCGTLGDGMRFFAKTGEHLVRIDAGAVEKMASAIAAGKPVVVCTKPQTEIGEIPLIEDDNAETSPLPTEHMMAVLRVDATAKTVELYDTVRNAVLFVPLADFLRCAGEALVATL